MFRNVARPPSAVSTLTANVARSPSAVSNQGSIPLAILEVTNLVKRYGELKAVDGVSFAIERGEIFGLLGPNGAGKSTTINIIATLLRPDAGEIILGGTRLSASAAYKRRLGYVPQEISLAGKLTGRENLALVARLYDLRGRALTARVDQTLGAIGLSDRADDLLGTYSGGMKRRLNIGAALLHEPVLLLLDEPTVGVDPQARAYIFDIIEGLAAEGRSILYTTHYMEEAERLCRRTAIIDHGKILAMGTLEELTRLVGAQREIVIEAEGLDEERAGRMSKKLGGAGWTIHESEARFRVAETHHALLSAVRAADEAGLEPRSIRILTPNLEDVFLELTGRALRE